MSKRAQSAERKYYGTLYSGQMKNEREGFIKGYERAEQEFAESIKTAEDHAYFAGSESMREKVISLIESRIGEILGDAQPAPVLRAELRELIKRIKVEES